VCVGVCHVHICENGNPLKLGEKPKQEEALLPISSLSSCFVLWNGRVPLRNTPIPPKSTPIPPTNVVSSVGRVVVPPKKFTRICMTQDFSGNINPLTKGVGNIPQLMNKTRDF